MMWHAGSGFWPGGALLVLLVVIVLVVGIVSLFAFLTRSSRPAPPFLTPPTPPVDPALQILRERFARGEIAQAEFEERKRALGG
jgi:putative membrane protein